MRNPFANGANPLVERHQATSGAGSKLQTYEKIKKLK